MDKKLFNSMCPDENELAMFIEGKLTGDRLIWIRNHLDSCSLCNDMVKLAMELDAMGEKTNDKHLDDPAIHKLAALSKWNLCVLQAEMYILQFYKLNFDMITLMELADKHGWLSKGGVQFKNIGKLLEFFDFEVERKTNAAPGDIKKALEQGYHVIVGVDEGELFPHSKFEKIYEIVEDWFERKPDHALIVTGIQMENDSEKIVNVINFENDQPTNYTIPYSKFMGAWEDSGNYMVVVEKKQIKTIS